MNIAADQLLPHAAPMIFIDELIEVGQDYAIAQLHIRPELMFMEAAGLPSWVSIEIMAQCISLFAGYHGQQQGQAPKIGFLLGTRKLHLPISHFPLSSKLQIHVNKNYMHDNLGVFICQVHYLTHVIEATLSVYEPPALS